MSGSLNLPPYGVQYLEHGVLHSLRPGEICQAWVRVENSGAGSWHPNPASGGRIDLVVWTNGINSGTYILPKEVRPGENIKIPFSFRAPSEIGIHTLKCDMVEQGVTFFEDQGIGPLVLNFEVVESVEPGERDKKKAHRLTNLPVYGMRCIDLAVPEKVQKGARFYGRVCLENRGTLVWRSGPDVPDSVDLVVFLNDVVVGTTNLPLSRVGLTERVVIHLSIPAPEERACHKLKIGLVRQNVALFEDRGVAPILVEFETVCSNNSLTGRLYETALRRNAWFYRPTSGISNSLDGRGFPVFVSKAKGCHVWDTDGRKYIDYTMGWGCALLGYANDRITRAMINAMDSGAILPFPDRLMVDVSEMLCEDIPCAEMVAFGKNGSDVCTLAVRLARLVTGREKVLVSGYHGWQDWYAELQGFEGSGVPERPERLIHHFRFNDYDDFRTLFELHRQDLAAVMLEPSGPGESVQGPRQDVSPEFLRKIALDARQAGALLIFDEIITGFRYLEGSVQKATGVIPDLACFGKALGAGAPISALAGRGDIMAAAMPRAFYGPTFKDDTYSLAAAGEAMKIYRTEPVADHVWDFGSRLIGEVNTVCRSLDLPAGMAGPPFRFSLAFTEEDSLRLTQLRTLYQQELLKGGIITYNSVMLPSYAHDRAVFQKTLDVIVRALELAGRALKGNTLDAYIEIPLLPR